MVEHFRVSKGDGSWCNCGRKHPCKSEAKTMREKAPLVWIRGKGYFDIDSYSAAEILKLAYEFVMDADEPNKYSVCAILISAENHVLETGKI